MRRRKDRKSERLGGGAAVNESSALELMVLTRARYSPWCAGWLEVRCGGDVLCWWCCCRDVCCRSAPASAALDSILKSACLPEDGGGAKRAGAIPAINVLVPSRAARSSPLPLLHPGCASPTRQIRMHPSSLARVPQSESIALVRGCWLVQIQQPRTQKFSLAPPEL